MALPWFVFAVCLGAESLCSQDIVSGGSRPMFKWCCIWLLKAYSHMMYSWVLWACVHMMLYVYVWESVSKCYCVPWCWGLVIMDTLYDNAKSLYPCNSVGMLNPWVPNMLHVCNVSPRDELIISSEWDFLTRLSFINSLISIPRYSSWPFRGSNPFLAHFSPAKSKVSLVSRPRLAEPCVS